MNFKRAHLFAFSLPLFTTFCFVAWFCFQSLNGQGIFVYALDDPYIHLAIAKNFALHGVWGITSREFTSASSSPLWTALLALGLKISGPNLSTGSLWPLVLTSLSAVLLIWALWREALRYLSPVASALIMVVVVMATPIPTLIVSGQEHILHCVVIFLLILGYAKVLACPETISRKNWRLLLFLTSTAVLIRYESLFLTAVFGLLLLGQKRFREAFLFVGVAAAPAFIFGILSMMQGWPPVPNSIWLKANTSHPLLAVATYQQLWNRVPEVIFCLFVVIGTGFWLHLKSRIHTNRPFTNNLTEAELKARCVLLAGLFLLHLALARVGWLFRYEAYLLFASSLVFLPLLSKISLRPQSGQFRQWIAGFLLGAFFLNFVTQRTIASLEDTPDALKNIRDQQWQMARFFEEEFPNSSLALNDIGAVSYLRESQVLDLFGLANLEVATARRNGLYGFKVMEAIASNRNVEYIAICPLWFDSVNLGQPIESFGRTAKGSKKQISSEIPRNWIRCADWELEKAYFDPNVSFYATSPQSAEKLRAAMREFAVSLPSTEICTIIEADGKRRRAN